MTEDQWVASDDSQAMLRYLEVGSPGSVPETTSDRKLRLFAVACCRAVWGLLTDERSRNAVEVAERFANGEASIGELSKATHQAWRVTDAIGWINCKPAWMAWWASGLQTDGIVAAHRNNLNLILVDASAQTALLREVAGNPFRAVTLPYDRLNFYLMDEAYGVAFSAYDAPLSGGTLDSSRLLVLADALEEAGCDDDDLLSHLRSPGPHVRGCWVLDLILGKE